MPETQPYHGRDPWPGMGSGGGSYQGTRDMNAFHMTVYVEQPHLMSDRNQLLNVLSAVPGHSRQTPSKSAQYHSDIQMPRSPSHAWPPSRRSRISFAGRHQNPHIPSGLPLQGPFFAISESRPYMVVNGVYEEQLEGVAYMAV